MRASIIYSTIFASAAIAAPILNLGGVSPVGLADTLGTTVTGANSGVTERGVEPSALTELASGLTKRQDNIVDDVPAGEINRRLLTLGDLLGTVTGLLSDVTSEVDGLKSTISSLLEHVEGADVEGILTDVEGLVGELLAKVQDIVEDAGLGLDLSACQPALDTLSNEVGTLVKQVQGLLDVGIVSDLIDEITSVLQDILTLVDNLVSVKTLVGSS